MLLLFDLWLVFGVVMVSVSKVLKIQNYTYPGDDASSASMSPQHGFGKRQQSLAAKAKNYPFQQ